MKKRQLANLGYEGKEILAEAVRVCGALRHDGVRGAELRVAMKELFEQPSAKKDDPILAKLAMKLLEGSHASADNPQSYNFRNDLKYNCWGDDIDDEAHLQMENACKLPISVQAALMPDAHVGYGLPIGGVLATKDAVIPYAVGVDIACRVMLSVLDMPLVKFKKDRARFRRAIEENTRFGMGAKWKEKKQHKVLDMNWNVTPFTAELKNLAWSQLGTSGSGNHFVEFGEITFDENHQGLASGTYIGLVSHSGSRGPGSKVANHYTKIAMAKHHKLPKQLKHLAWLDMASDGAEYWAAMELMGEFASANHHVIHREVLRALGVKPMFQVENHHNFAWKEVHGGEEVIVHRKGATPAGEGELGYIPGSMTAAGFLVEGMGVAASLNSCSHGAGRKMSRKKAKNSITNSGLRKQLETHGVELISAGLDEAPHAYKNIEEVMKAQQTLVKPIAKFQPRLVKMAPAGEKPED